MRLEFNYIMIDDDLGSSRNKRRAQKIQDKINQKIEEKGFIPKCHSYISFEDFSTQENQDTLKKDRHRFDLYLSDNNLGNSSNDIDNNKHANDGIQIYLDLHKKFPCNFVLYSGATQDEIINKLITHLKENKDAGLFSHFTFVSRSSDDNEAWIDKITDVIEMIISKREEINTFRGLYAQLTSKIHLKIKNILALRGDHSFNDCIEELEKKLQDYNNIEQTDINILHKIRYIRNGLMHNDEQFCEQSDSYFIEYKYKQVTSSSISIEKIYIKDFDNYRKELRAIYDKIMKI